MENRKSKSTLIAWSNMIMAMLLLSSCGQGSGDAKSQTDNETVLAIDSVDGDILSKTDLAAQIEKGLAGSSDSQLRVSYHFRASAGGVTNESLGWLLASAQAGNPESVQSLMTFIISTERQDRCKVAEFWFSEINKESQAQGFTKKHFSDRQAQDEYFGFMKLKINGCWDKFRQER